jgi:hypothetical protein
MCFVLGGVQAGGGTGTPTLADDPGSGGWGRRREAGCGARKRNWEETREEWRLLPKDWRAGREKSRARWEVEAVGRTRFRPEEEGAGQRRSGEGGSTK